MLPSHTYTAPSLPGRDDKEVHDVPHVPHVAVFVEDEAHREDPGAHLDREDDHEDGLELLLQCDKHDRQMGFYVCPRPLLPRPRISVTNHIFIHEQDRPEE